MRKDSVAFDLNRSSSEVLEMLHSNYFHACREHENTRTCFQQDAISPSIFLFSNSGRLVDCFPAPTYYLHPPFPSIPGRPPLMKSCGMSESLSACACRYTMPFSLEGVVSMHTIQFTFYNKDLYCMFILLAVTKLHHNVLCVCM